MLRDLLLKNFGWKLLSLALATIFWFTVKTAIIERGNQSDRNFVNIPVQIVSSVTDVRTFKVTPLVVSVTVRGRPEVINALTERELHAIVDVTSADLSQHFSRRVEIAAPIGITISRIDPVEVAVELPPKPTQLSPKLSENHP